MSQSQSMSADQPEAIELNASTSRRSPLLTARSPLSIRQDVAGQSCCPDLVRLRHYQAIVDQMLFEHQKMDRLESEIKRFRAEDMVIRADFQHKTDALRKVLKHREDQLKKLRVLISKDENKRTILLKKELLMAQDQLRQFHLKKNRYDELKMAVTCAICLNARCSTAFQCGHLSCGDCSGHLLHCHICRLPILRRTHIIL